MIVSLLVLGVGLGTGLVAYYVGFPVGTASSAPEELRFLPRNAALVAYADVRAVMVSEVRQRILDVLPAPSSGQHDFESQTGINISTDVDRVVACLTAPDAQPLPLAGMALVRGRFNETKIEALMRSHGAREEDYKGARLLLADVPMGQSGSTASLSLAFVEPGLVAVGTTALIRSAVDLKGGGDNVTGNDEMMDFVKTFGGDNAWAVGRFDVLTAQARLPQGVTTQLPSITWFSAGARVDTGIAGTFRADARDEAAATSLRDVLRGIVAFAKLQTAAHPELQPMLDSLQLGGTGKSVTLAFDVTPQMFDQLAGALKSLRPAPPAPK